MQKKDLIKIQEQVIEQLSLKNKMQAPRIQKVVVNMGTGEIARNKEAWEKLIGDLTRITGQKPKITKAKTSIAGFNLREGQQVGLTVTLRRDKMYSFLEKLITIVLPRLRDFRGVPTKSFDKNGNYTLGVTEHTIFPEIDIAKVDKPRGMEITIVTNCGSSENAKTLLTLFGMPFEKPEN